MTILKSMIGQQKTFIDPQAYVDMNEDFINGIYNDYEEKDKFKDYILLVCDSSICDSPNTKLIYKEYILLKMYQDYTFQYESIYY